MNQFQKAFLQGGFALFHCDLLVDEVYNKKDIYSNRTEFKKMINGCKRLYDSNAELTEIKIEQFKYNKNDTLIIVGKLLEKVDVQTSDGISSMQAIDSATKSKNKIAFALLDLDYKYDIKRIVLRFKGNIIDPLEIPVNLEHAQKIEEPVVIPEVTSNFSLGASLVNIKFKVLPSDYDTLEITLYDNVGDVLGVFKPKEGMRFLAITDLAFDKYKYHIQVKKDDVVIAESKMIDFTLNKPNYGGKPTRGPRG